MSSKRKLPSFLLSQPGGARHRSQPAISSATSSSAIDLTLDSPPREHQLAHPPAALLTSSQSSPPSPTSLSPPSPLAPPSPPPPFRLFDLPSELLLPIVSHLSFWELFHCRAVCRAFAPLLSGDSSAFALYTALSLQPSAFCDPIRTSPYSEDHASQEEWVMAYDDRHVARIRRLLSTWTFPSVRALYLGRAASDVSLIPQRCRLVERLHYSVSESLSERVSTTFLAAFPAVHAVEMKGVNVMTHLQCLLEHEQLTAVSLEQEQGAELSRGHRHTQEQLRLVYETMGGRRGRWPALRSLKLEGLKWRWITSQLAAPESLTSLSIVRAEDDPLPLPLSSWLWKHPSLTQLTLSCVPARASSTSLTANLFDDYAQHQDQLEATRAAAAAAAPASRSRRKVTSAMPLSDPVVALSPVVAYRTYTALLSLDVSGNEWVTERGLRQIGAVYPSLTSLNLGDNRQLGKQALLVALSLQHFPSLTSLHANRLRKTAFAAVNTPQCPFNSNLRLLHLAGCHSEPVDSASLDKADVDALSSHFPSLTSLDLSHRHHISSATLHHLLTSLPKLKELRVERMKLGSLAELEELCVVFSRTLRSVRASITGVLTAKEARRLKRGRMVQEGKAGDEARREFSAEAQERVWLGTGSRVTLHLDVEGVHGTGVFGMGRR